MPYTIKKNKSGSHCVHKKGADGKATGKSLGCHKSRKKAQAQIAAIVASEGEGMKKSKSAEIVDVDNVTKLVDLNGMGMSAYMERIRDAWNREYDWDGWVVDVFGDHVIVRKNKKHWRITYTIENEGADIDFAPQNEWMEVSLKQEWTEKSLYCVKALGENRIGGYAALWGDETAKDLHGEYFTPETEEMDVVFKSIGKLPWLFHHGKDAEVKTTVIGEVDILEFDERGAWYEAKIKEHEMYRRYVAPLIANKMLYTSSGTFPGAKEADRETGHITRWPFAEITGTHLPAEYRMLEVPIDELSKTYTTLGVDEGVYMKAFGLSTDESANESESDAIAKTGDSEEEAQSDNAIKKDAEKLARINRMKYEIRQRQLKLRLNSLKT